MRPGGVMALALALMVVPNKAFAADQTLLLEVEVNGHTTDKIGEFTLRDGRLMAQRRELLDLGFRVPVAVAGDADGLIPLSSLGVLVWRLDQTAQTLTVNGSDDLLMPLLLRVGVGSDGPIRIESGTGLTLDYDIAGSSGEQQRGASGLFDLRAFSPWGIASTGLLAHTGDGASSFGAEPAVRLDSTYTYSDVDTLRRYRLGDFITGSLGWTRPVRLGGAQVTSDFSLRPDLITSPLPSLRGTVAVPSAVVVLANGRRLFTSPVQPGPFEIRQLPVVDGAGTLSMTLTDALGRQVVTTLPFYASTNLLAAGLQTFSAQAGALRRNWGAVSNDYGDLAATATYRRGVADTVTVEATAEGARGALMAGGGVVVNVANFALANLAVAGSGGGGAAGGQVSAGVRRSAGLFSFGLASTVSTKDFRDVAAVGGDAAPRLQLTANAGLSLGRLGSIGLAYAELRRDASTVGQSDTGRFGGDFLQPAEHSRVFTASYSTQVRNVALYATGFRDFGDGGGSTGILFGLSVPLGSRSSVGGSVASGTGGPTYQVQATQSAASIGDWGYQLVGSRSQVDHEFGQVQYRAPWALLTAGADRSPGQTTLRLEAQGSLSYVDGGLFASNTIADSFAIVDTNGLAGVRVLRENRIAGRTDGSGRLLVPDLRSFEINRLALNPLDIPADTTLDVATMEVRPMDRSGVVVRFPVRVSHGALLRLVDAGGHPLDLGATATLLATGVTVPVGYDGLAYVEDLSPSNALAVEQRDGERCAVRFDYVPVAGDIPTIGPLSCR